ncbi:MAG: ATP-binding protein [Janthinobacterium lividum]
MRSIRKRLLVFLLGCTIAGIAAAGFLIYRQAQAEANELFDYQLRQTAGALPSEPFSSVLGSNSDNDGVVIQIWSREGVQLYYSHPRAPLAQRAELGFSTEHTSQGDWRVYSAVVGDNVVQLAQPMAVRTALAAEVAWRTIWPLLVLLPILGLLVWLVVGRGLRPLARLAAVLEARRPDAVEPLTVAPLPVEVAPLVAALNGLLRRLSIALGAQKAFVADAAHELRTPLAALKIQLQWLRRARDDADRAAAFDAFEAGIARATRLVEQMLALARAEPDAAAALGHAASPLAWSSIQLDRLLSDCVEDQAGVALERGVDLGIVARSACQVDGDAEALAVMFNNLLDNAVKYTPAGGRVDVSIGLAGVPALPTVEIVDAGPGIPPDERARVFDRFYRVPGNGEVSGSGLGLSIVARVAERHGASVSFDDGPDGRGLCVRVIFARHPQTRKP